MNHDLRFLSRPRGNFEVKPTTITSPYCVLEKEVDATLPGNGCHVELNNGLNNRYFNLLQKVMAPIVLAVYFGNTDNVFM